MKNLLYLTAMLYLFTQNTGASSLDLKVKKSLEMWDPLSVTRSNNVLRVTTKEHRVTDKIYQAMISGICIGVLRQPNSISGIAEIRILNKFGRQGYVFEGGDNECREFVELPASKTRIFVLNKTHMHMNN